MSDAPKTAPELIAEAVATGLCVVLPLPKTEEGSEFDKAMREQLAKIETGQKGARFMTAAERAECERITREIHAEARAVLKDRV